MTLKHCIFYVVAPPEFQFAMDPNFGNAYEITVPFYSNPFITTFNFSVKDKDMISVKDEGTMEIINSSVKLKVHGSVAKVPGQAFIWTLRTPNTSTGCLPCTLTIWNDHGMSNFSFYTSHYVREYNFTGNIRILNQKKNFQRILNVKYKICVVYYVKFQCHYQHNAQYNNTEQKKKGIVLVM